MSEFLVEAYHPTGGPLTGAPAPRDVALAADRLARDGRRISLVRSVLVPGDETCFYLFEGGSCEDVLEVATRAGLCFERVVPARSVWVMPVPGSSAEPAPDRGGRSLRQ